MFELVNDALSTIGFGMIVVFLGILIFAFARMIIKELW